MTEVEISEMIKNGDEQGMNELIKKYGPLMRYIISPILNNTHDTEDCLMEAAMRVWNKIYLFDGSKGSFKAWLTSVTRNTALNYLKQCRADGEIPDELPSPDATPEEEMIRKERQRELERALKELSQRDRMLIYRRYYYMQPLSQIASELGTTERAVEGRLYRLKKRLRKALGGEYFD